MSRQTVATGQIGASSRHVSDDIEAFRLDATATADVTMRLLQDPTLQSVLTNVEMVPAPRYSRAAPVDTDAV